MSHSATKGDRHPKFVALYSLRRAIRGSSFEALRAGSQAATIEAINSLELERDDLAALCSGNANELMKLAV